MEPLVRASPVATALVIGTFVAAFVGEWAVTFRTRLNEARARSGGGANAVRAAATALAEINLLMPRERGERDRNTKQVLIVVTLGGLLLGWAAATRVPGARLPGNPWIALCLGLALMWAGVALRLWGVATLGSFFRRVVVVQAGHRIVTDGPYRFIRHPAYAGNLLSYLGLGLALGNGLSVAACALLPLLGHLPRIIVEEAALAAGLGEEYQIYARRTARLIPKVW